MKDFRKFNRKLETPDNFECYCLQDIGEQQQAVFHIIKRAKKQARS